jgi:hypothetical protein
VLSLCALVLLVSLFFNKSGSADMSCHAFTIQA